MYLFTPPTVLRPTGINHPLFGRMRLHQGVSLLKDDAGLYQQVEGPTAEQIDLATIAYLGGHIYLVSDAEASSLRDAGYGEWVTIPAASSGYGKGSYGGGLYGAPARDITGFGAGAFGAGPYGED